MSPLLITSVLLASFSYFVDAQFQCPIKNGVRQSCVKYTACEEMAKALQESTQTNREKIWKAFCGWSGTTPMVCCPTTKCLTADGEQGTCIFASSCPRAVSIYQDKALTIEKKRNLLTKLWCEGAGKNYVCCYPPPNSNTRNRSSNGKCVLTATPPEPGSKCCGVDSSSGGNRIFAGNVTTVDAYPWMALIEYNLNDEIKFYCGGALISGRYVLTAAHCVTGDKKTQGTPVNVRLGEYDFNKSGPDCVVVDGGGTDCTEGEVIVPIEKIIPHPDYKPTSVQQRDDIALLRLNRVVEYTDFIRPICLPSIDFTKSPPDDLTLFASGWGAVNVFKNASNVKLAVGMPYVTNQECEAAYKNYDNRIQLWEGQLCAGGRVGDTCAGDSGGPLMMTNRRFTEAVGIVSFGLAPCGMYREPGVYTNVHKYLSWIRNNIVS